MTKRQQIGKHILHWNKHEKIGTIWYALMIIVGRTIARIVCLLVAKGRGNNMITQMSEQRAMKQEISYIRDAISGIKKSGEYGNELELELLAERLEFLEGKVTMNDIILRDCGNVGWLAIIKEDDEEVYRTGMHYPSAEEALEKAKFMLISIRQGLA